MSKKRKWLLFISIVLLLPLIPFLFSIVIRLISFVTIKLKIPILFTINDIIEISLSDYIAIVVSLISCISAVWLGVITYRLSNSIHEYTQAQQRNAKRFAAHSICIEIQHNVNVLNSYTRNVASKPEEIQLDAFNMLEIVCPELSVEGSNYLLDLYRICKQFKEQSTFSVRDTNIKKLDDDTISIQTIIDELKRI